MMYVAEFFEKNGGFQRQRSGTVVLWTPPSLQEGALVLPALLFAQDGVHPENLRCPLVVSLGSAGR